ncbi:hypothetical protein BV22DRAFT_1125393 [Leucogyrophana mollusca]|uniref:Uncharacterized protein n=1 Tax=Leucogyrophana mollusca TaxID=85980 RepID=A0ACB8BWK2_9AGAM|nr:hypothetical protein BV22DRAFT_1125393 [Leucogyrophana mollusca]
MLRVASCLLAIAVIAGAVPNASLVEPHALTRRQADSPYPPQCESICDQSNQDDDKCDNIPDPQWHSCHCDPSSATDLGNCASCLFVVTGVNLSNILDAYNKVCGTSVTIDPSYTNVTTGGSGGGSTGGSPGSTSGATPTGSTGGSGGGSSGGSSGSSTGGSTGGSSGGSSPGQSPFGSGGGAAELKAAAGLAVGLASAAIVSLLAF